MKIQKGFTIIELVVVITIIAILATIILSNIIGYIKSSKSTFLLGEFKQLTTAGTDYYSANGTYNGFCQSSNMAGIASAIVNHLSSSLYLRCVDSSGAGGSYYQQGLGYFDIKSLFPIAYAVFPPANCTDLKYVVYIYNSPNSSSNICVSADTSVISGYIGSLGSPPGYNHCSCQ